MTTFAVAFKDQVRRLARKEIRQQTGILRRASAQHRRDLAALKRLIASLQKQLKRGGVIRAAAAAAEEDDGLLGGARFSARSVRAQRARLGLSAADFGKLVGVSPLTIYHWESGKARPRSRAMAGFVAVRNISKPDAFAKLGLKEGKLGRRGMRRRSPSRRGKGRAAAAAQPKEAKE